MKEFEKQKMLLEKHKDIARIDQESKRTHGWYVRVRFIGKTHSKFFSDKKCGGRYSSLLSAISWRDKIEKKIGKIRTNKHMVTVSNSSTGVVGVRLNEKLSRYEVSWVTHQGKQGKTSVSIKKHGKKSAFAKACAIRQQKEQSRLEYSA
ncbi:AP2 domain-containing protein [Desulfopila aestuarii]|uniref:AP2 domain-containing protein n=1 Tax=Desulfopila aestuarii DSM 18488 TaxID=1121416 RepID=A0A1M7Y4Y3_9BACT|nr:AP2 domain-containing protein [Desulfopila aestuarii]SHO47370.1 AP2 domain-containing protein [Desulfopila aestuarii DSM 18488]